MIKRIDHSKLVNANNIWDIFHHSYTVEAKILKVDNFPPLNRSISQIMKSNNIFFAFYNCSDLVALIEIDSSKKNTHIQSLVVYPNHFRKGYARRLIKFVFNIFDSDDFSVETGFDNIPAKNLYSNLGFQELLQYEAERGIKKIKYIKKNN
jgi:ribosomal protein S18 acetylase RimI-like enzyme